MAFRDVNRSPILKKLPGIVTGIGAGQTAIVRVPPGATYLELVLQCTIAGVAATRAELETMLGDIRLTLSGVEKFTVSAKQLIAIAEFYRSGVVGDTGYLVIPFERLWMSTAAARQNPAYGTLGEDSFQVEVQQLAGSTISAIQAFARVAPVAEELGAHMTIKRLTPNIGALGKFYYPDLPKLPGWFLYALHIQWGSVGTIADLTNVAVVADEIRVVDCAPALENRYLTLGNPARTPQTAKGFFTVDFTARNEDEDALSLIMDELVLELDVATNIPGQINVLAEIAMVKPSTIAPARPTAA
jgi:hypothetical protein